MKQLNASSITATEVDGDPITNIRTTSLYKDMPIDGVRVETETGWFVARPDRKSTRLNSSHITRSRMPSSA